MFKIFYNPPEEIHHDTLHVICSSAPLKFSDNYLFSLLALNGPIPESEKIKLNFYFNTAFGNERVFKG